REAGGGDARGGQRGGEEALRPGPAADGGRRHARQALSDPHEANPKRERGPGYRHPPPDRPISLYPEPSDLRMTTDVDVVVNATRSEYDRLIARLKKAGFRECRDALQALARS